MVLPKGRPHAIGTVRQSAFTARSLLFLGGGCLLIAVILTFVMLPQSFRPLSREGFQSHVLEANSSREGIELSKTEREFEGRFVQIIEWKESSR